MNKIFNFPFGKQLDKSLDHLFSRKQPPKWIFAIILVLYFVVSYFLTAISRNTTVLNFMGHPVPITTFTGVLSSVANMLLIFLVVFFHTAGYFTSLVIFLLQFPMLFINLFLRHNNASIPGIFTNLFTIVAVTLIYLTNCMIDKYQKKIRTQAITDTLTGLPNRFACIEYMEKLIKHKTNFMIVSIDINNFKNINDTMGHDIGDKILKELSLRWTALAESKTTQTEDFVTRNSGDTFTIIITKYKYTTDVLGTIAAYKSELEKTITVDNCDYFLTACFGFAEFPVDADTSTSLLSCADAAMHKLKKTSNRTSILRYTPDLLETEHSLEIERKIRTALDTNSILCYLQPQYDMNHKLRGFEALARLKDTDGKLVSPADFIPIAEKTGLIDLIDLSVLSQAAAFISEALKKGQKNIIVSFNISVRHLMKNSFIEEIKKVIKTSGVPASNLELEITESIMIDSEEKALQRINEIKEMGMNVAIDDFGTGYSSLSYLRKIPADLLKIDKSFIDTLNYNESSKKYVASIVSIGHVLNLEVISEGVESDAQLETLQSIGCDHIQGYIWGKPIPPSEAETLL